MSKKGIAQRNVLKVRAASLERGADAVAVEEPLEIRVWGEPVAVTMRTPGDDARLAVGFLFSEGLIRSLDDLSTVTHCGRPGEEGYGNVIDVIPASGVSLDIERLSGARRGTLTTAACGVCGRKSVEDLLALCGELPEGPVISREVLLLAPEKLRALQENFSRTGGTHAAAILDARGQLLCGFEDIGRHNAVDKAIGHLVYQRKVASSEDAPTILVVSGRASFEIVQKAVVARIPIVASVSAASSLAIDLAEKSRLTLATFVRDGGGNIYTHPERIKGLGAGG